MKFEIETKRTLITDNGNRFTEGSEIAFTYKNSGDKYIAEIVQIKKKSLLVSAALESILGLKKSFLI